MSTAINHGHKDSAPVITVRNLNKVYVSGKKNLYALRGVSLKISSGEFVAIMGPSGSGKSTFLNLIGCLDVATSGEYWLAGKQVSCLSNNQLANVRNQFIGFICQGFNLLGRADALSNVRLPMLYAGLPWKLQLARAYKLLRVVGLSKYVYRRPSELSGGQQQRVAIARALACNPALLLADEPTGALDSHTSMEIMAVLQAMNQQGLTIILVTHDAKVARYAKRQITFLDGQIIHDEPVLNRLSAQIEWEIAMKRDKEAARTPTANTTAFRGKDQTNQSARLLTRAAGTLIASSHESTATRRQPLRDIIQNVPAHKGRGRSLHMVVANVQSAIVALWANHTRSFLTVLGIFVGVAAVMTALIFSQGANAKFNTIGSNAARTISILPVIVSSNNAGSLSSSLTFNDLRSVENLPDIAAISPIININAQAIYDNQNWSTQIQGVNENYQVIGDWQMAQGSWFSADDNVHKETVAVLGNTVMHNLFDASGDNPIGKTIRIRAHNFRIIGVLSAKGGGLGNDPDDVIYVPINSALIYLKNTTTIDRMQVMADDTQNINAIQQTITHILEQNHHILPKNNDDFYVTAPTQASQQFQTFASLLTFLLIGIATISLTVGGIGVMDIMIVSVTERTREIGIRMSLGARRRDILGQFLVEALVLCLIGGATGLVLGLLIGLLITSLNGFQFILSAETFLVPFVVTTVVAIISGIYPAVRASRLDPVVAIRTEA